MLKVDTEGCEVPIFASLLERLGGVKVIYLEYHSEADRRELDAMLSPTHQLFFGRLVGDSGELLYLAHHLVPDRATFDLAALFRTLIPG